MDAREHRRTYTVVIESDPKNGGFVATMPALPGIVGRGETEEAALRHAKAALGGHGTASAGFEKDTDPETLAKEQGVSPADFDKLLKGDFWPEDEGPNEFTDALRRWRREGLPEDHPDVRDLSS